MSQSRNDQNSGASHQKDGFEITEPSKLSELLYRAFVFVLFLASIALCFVRPPVSWVSPNPEVDASMALAQTAEEAVHVIGGKVITVDARNGIACGSYMQGGQLYVFRMERKQIVSARDGSKLAAKIEGCQG